jgi:hypothetical protein
MEGGTLFIPGEPATKSLGAKLKKIRYERYEDDRKRGKRMGGNWALRDKKIREPILGSACVLNGCTDFFEEIQKKLK